MIQKEELEGGRGGGRGNYSQYVIYEKINKNGIDKIAFSIYNNLTSKWQI